MLAASVCRCWTWRQLFWPISASATRYWKYVSPLMRYGGKKGSWAGDSLFSWDLTVFDSPHQQWSVLYKQANLICFSVFVLLPKTSLKHDYLKTHHRLLTAAFYCLFSLKFCSLLHTKHDLTPKVECLCMEGIAFPSSNTEEKLRRSDQLLPALN